MDYAACNVIYVDRNARVGRLVKRGDATIALLRSSTASGVTLSSLVDPPEGDVYENLEVLLESFSAGKSLDWNALGTSKMLTISSKFVQ